jgi:predicted MFS family arabinose efflux permease
MAVIGISVGASFVLSILLGPVLAGLIGVRGLFVVAVGLAFVAIALVLFAVPIVDVRKTPAPQSLRLLFADRALLALDAGVFLLHLLLTTLFVALPFVLRDALGLDEGSHWRVYLGALVLSLAGTVPMILAAERDPTGRRGWRLASALVAGGLALLLVRPGLWSVVAGLALFFAGFNVLEARLPAEISRRSDASRRGASLSVFATAQLLGAFAGGACGGLLLGAGGPRGVFGAGTVVALAGVLLAAAATRRVAPVPAGG